jgi:hypothetical protein
MVDVSVTVIIGNSGAISTTKVREITAVNKNFSKNDSHSDLCRLKLHLNGDLSSHSSILF